MRYINSFKKYCSYMNYYLEEGDEGYGDSYEPAHSKSSKGGPCAEDDDGISNNR